MNGERQKRPGGGGGRAGSRRRRRELGLGLGELARRQHGVVASRQLAGLGIGPATVRGMVEAGQLLAVRRDVYATGHAPLQRRDLWMAAVLACGQGALLSHESAACLWGLAGHRHLLDVTAPGGRQGVRRRAGIRLHRCRIHPEDRRERNGIPVTSVARTLFDFAEVVHPERLRHAWEEADRLKLLRLREMEEVAERGYGRRALKPIRRLLAAAKAPAEGRSPLEQRFHAFCQDHRLPEPVRNVHVLGREVDALWPDAKLVVELDSWEHHGHRAAFERDRAREPAFLVAGYRTIRVTSRRLDHEAAQLAAEIRALLDP